VCERVKFRRMLEGHNFGTDLLLYMRKKDDTTYTVRVVYNYILYFFRKISSKFLQSYDFYHFYFTQCASDSFRITPSYYSLYLDPVERNRELQISWVSFFQTLAFTLLPLFFILLIKNQTRSGIAKWM